MESSTIEQTPFVKQLAANDRPTRDQALESLKTYLSGRHRPTRDQALESLKTYLSGRRSLPPLELLKLHKGLFYSLWLSDRPIPQQNLASSLASLLGVLPAETLIPFLRAFWQTMAREWTHIDVLRMEKFLLLVRRYVGSSLTVLKEGGWETERVQEVLDVYEEIPLSVGDVRVPMGLRFHVVDVWVDELERVGLLEDVGVTGMVLEQVMAPLVKLREGSPTKIMRRKADDALADERIPGNEKEVVKEDGGSEWAGFDD
ncbi:hypothetical protein HYALB_00012173 [Hymenoscyphus albidus]|uniref:Ribosomal RNA-processing protein 1 n=1 Tax=Hymenoscyphus albidus TaxID=595503 RepID=A0A9N9LNX1_9HELO|nr:hypothetical protein HYALB_00012173 [Hymenoscyphus albidus]